MPLPLLVRSLDQYGMEEIAVEIRFRLVHMQIYFVSRYCSKCLTMCRCLWLSALWIDTEWRRSLWRLDLGEYTCKSILLLVTVARVYRCVDANATGCALSGLIRNGGDRRGD